MAVPAISPSFNNDPIFRDVFGVSLTVKSNGTTFQVQICYSFGWNTSLDLVDAVASTARSVGPVASRSLCESPTSGNSLQIICADGARKRIALIAFLRPEPKTGRMISNGCMGPFVLAQPSAVFVLARYQFVARPNYRLRKVAAIFGRDGKNAIIRIAGLRFGPVCLGACKCSIDTEC